MNDRSFYNQYSHSKKKFNLFMKMILIKDIKINVQFYSFSMNLSLNHNEKFEINLNKFLFRIFKLI